MANNQHLRHCIISQLFFHSTYVTPQIKHRKSVQKIEIKVNIKKYSK